MSDGPPHSSFPPPAFDPPGYLPPPPAPTAGQPSQPASPPSSSKTAKIVAATVVVAALAVGGIYLATRGDDNSGVTLSTDTEAEADTTDVPATTAAPVTTQAPTTTVAPTSTTIHVLFPEPTSPPTTEFTVPAGAVDLGHQVYIPLPDGWTHSKDDASGVDSLTDGTAKVDIQVLERTPGESPQAALQEYIDTFSGYYDAVGVAPSRKFSVPGPTPSVEYGVFYRTWNASGVDTLIGGAYVFQRGDGLSAIYDVYAPQGTMGVPTDAFNAFENSFAAAAPIGDVLPLGDYPTFRVNGLQAPVLVDGVLGFTPTAGFTQITAGDGYGLVRQGGEDFAVARLPAQAGLDAALQQAEASLNADYTGLTFGDVQTAENLGTITREGVAWNGTYSDGKATSGGIDVYFDPATTNAVAIIRSWYATADGIEPYKAEAEFMFFTMSDTMESIGIP